MHLTLSTILMCLTHPIHYPKTFKPPNLRTPSRQVKLSIKPQSNHSPVKPIGQRGTLCLLAVRQLLKQFKSVATLRHAEADTRRTAPAPRRQGIIMTP